MLIRTLVGLCLAVSFLNAAPTEAALKDTANECDRVVQDVRDLCNEMEDDYQSEVADHIDEIRNSKEITSVPVAARRLRRVKLTEATAARDFARECKAELDSVPASCRNHADYLDLAQDVKEANDSAIDFEVEANKLQKIASSVSKSPEVKALNQIMPGLLDLLSGSSSPIMKSGVNPNLPRVPASEK